MDLGWYLARLKNMGPAEIAHRIGERFRQRRLGRIRAWTGFAAPGGLTPLPGLREAVMAADPDQRAALAGAAGRALAGQFEALGVAWPRRPADDLFPSALWRLDPVSGRLWPGPETSAFAIDFRATPELGDVKYVWEINRLQFLVPLAAMVLRDGDRRAAAAIDRAVASWHAANPPFGGIAWAAGIEVALRAISLAVAVTLAGDRLAPETRAKVAEILSASRRWLENFPSRFSSANNHRVAELAGLVVIAIAEAQSDDAARAELVAEVLRQILPDGAGAEQSPSYAAFTVELALLCARLGRAAGAPLPAEFDQRLGLFIDWIDWLGDGRRTPAIGDDDEGRVLTLGQYEPDYPRSVAAAVAAYLGLPGSAPHGDPLRTLVFGRPAGTRSPPRGLRTFAAGGCTAWSGEVAGRHLHLVLDHGPLGYLSIAAHGHADALSLILSIDGEPVLVDPGTFLYGSGGDWRRWFRGTRAHNTLNLGVDQSEMAGPFNWSARAEAWLDEAVDRPALRLVARHDGYRRRFGVNHQRSVAATPDGLTVTDRLLGGTREAAIVFQLAPGLTAELHGTEARVERGGRALLRICFPDGEVVATSGASATDGGWVSPAFGRREPALRLSWRGRVGADGVSTRLAVQPAAAAVAALDTQPAQT
jgi:hypothetical protein